MSLAIETLIECAGWSALPDLENSIAGCLLATIEESKDELPDNAVVSLLFCDDERIRELNREFRGQDKATNVLSFPGPEPLESARFLGDIAVAFETVAREGREQHKSLDHHCRHMIVHGFLHLLGYDHEDEAEAEAMEDLEIRVLHRLGIENPYRGDQSEEIHGNERA